MNLWQWNIHSVAKSMQQQVLVRDKDAEMEKMITRYESQVSLTKQGSGAGAGGGEVNFVIIHAKRCRNHFKVNHFHLLEIQVNEKR